MTNPTSYTDEQVRKLIVFDRASGYKHEADVLESLLADRQRLQAEVGALRAALEVEMVDLELTTQAVIARDPKEWLLLRLSDQKRRVSTAINARATPNETKEARS